MTFAEFNDSEYSLGISDILELDLEILAALGCQDTYNLDVNESGVGLTTGVSFGRDLHSICLKKPVRHPKICRLDDFRQAAKIQHNFALVLH